MSHKKIVPSTPEEASLNVKYRGSYMHRLGLRSCVSSLTATWTLYSRTYCSPRHNLTPLGVMRRLFVFSFSFAKKRWGFCFVSLVVFAQQVTMSTHNESNQFNKCLMKFWTIQQPFPKSTESHAKHWWHWILQQNTHLPKSSQCHNPLWQCVRRAIFNDLIQKSFVLFRLWTIVSVCGLSNNVLLMWGRERQCWESGPSVFFKIQMCLHEGSMDSMHSMDVHFVMMAHCCGVRLMVLCLTRNRCQTSATHSVWCRGLCVLMAMATTTLLSPQTTFWIFELCISCKPFHLFGENFEFDIWMESGKRRIRAWQQKTDFTSKSF